MPFGNFQFRPAFQSKVFTPDDYVADQNKKRVVANPNQRQVLYPQDVQAYLRDNYLRSIADYISGGRRFNDVSRFYRTDEDPFVQQNYLERVKKNPFFESAPAYDAMKINQLGSKTARMNKRLKKASTKKEKRKYFD